MTSKVDVLLINPGSRSAVYQSLGDEFSAIETPSLAALFGTYMRKRSLSVEIIDAPAMGWSSEDVAAVVCGDFDPALVVLVVYGFQPSASTQNMTAAGEIARGIKERRPDIRIMMTGTHPAALPDRTLREEEIDFVCSGEGPRTIAMTATALKHGRKSMAGTNVPALWYWVGDAIMHTPTDLMSEEALNVEMPGAAWDLLPMEKYRAHNWHCFEHINERQPYASIHTSLGCPYHCGFCCINAPFGGSSYRLWEPERVGEEIELLRTQYGVRNIKFVDEMFVLNRKHVHGVCDQIITRGLKDLNIWAYARVDTVKDEYLTKLRDAGVRWLALGIESASKHVRDGVEKGRFGNEDILAVVRKVQAAGINVIGNFIFGLPDDTRETMRETLALALEANCEFANFYSAMGYPGSALYKEAKAKGWKLPDDEGGPGWIGYSQHAYETLPLPTETLSGGEVLAFRDAAFRTYFTAESYIGMVRRKFGAPVVEHIERMVAQPLPRQVTR